MALFKYWLKRSKKFRILIPTFSFQICFWNQFLTLGSGQTENMQRRVFAYFQLDHFPKSKIDSKSRFKWECPYYYSKKIIGAFWSVFKKSKKKWIYHWIFKVWFGWGWGHYLLPKKSEKAKHPQICISFGGNVGET